jgi:tetratricopeptide (TPR) repeat protein
MIQHKPDTALGYFFLGVSFMGQSDYETASGYLTKAVELNPKMTAAGIQLCRSYMKQEKYPEALKVLQDILKSKNKTAIVHRMIGDIYAIQGNFKQAVEEYSAVLVHSKGLSDKYPEIKDIEASNDNDEVKAGAFKVAYEKIFNELRENRKAGDGLKGRGAMMRKRRRMRQ